jgi:hypothetical protein
MCGLRFIQDTDSCPSRSRILLLPGPWTQGFMVASYLCWFFPLSGMKILPLTQPSCWDPTPHRESFTGNVPDSLVFCCLLFWVTILWWPGWKPHLAVNCHLYNDWSWYHFEYHLKSLTLFFTCSLWPKRKLLQLHHFPTTNSALLGDYLASYRTTMHFI